MQCEHAWLLNVDCACLRWERVQAGATQCPKACAVSFDPSTTARKILQPLNP